MPYIDAEEYLQQLYEENPDLARENAHNPDAPSSSRQRESIEASLAGAHSQSKGAWGEAIAQTLLEAKGVLMVEQIATPVRIVETYQHRGKKFYRIVWGEKVSGDWRGVLPGGRRVLAEAKARDRNLRWSDLQDHQVFALNRNYEIGGLSLLVYVHPEVRIVMSWPIPDFGPYKSIKPEEAHKYEWNNQAS